MWYYCEILISWSLWNGYHYAGVLFPAWQTCHTFPTSFISSVNRTESRFHYRQDLINQNIDEFEKGIDLLDLCDDNFKTDAIGLGFITSNRQKNCYLLSEQGYMLLVGFMKTEKSKEIRKNLRREYFSMRMVQAA